MTSSPHGAALYADEHAVFRSTVRTFIDREVAPAYASWENDGIVDRHLFERAGDQGLLMFATPEQYGGAGIDDFRFNAVLGQELARQGYASMTGLSLHNDVVGPYFIELTNDEQRRRWLPGLTAGRLISAIGMSEPGTGSDLGGIATRAVRVGDEYVVNGAKTFISNGQNADVVVVVVRTGEHRTRGLSLLVVERDTPGFTRGRRLDKIGLRAQDTSELSFDDARVPAANLLGSEGSGFSSLMRNLPQERLSIALAAVAASEGTLARTLDYVRERSAFGQPIGSFQNSRFVLAELATSLEVARIYIDHCVAQHVRGQLSAVGAAKAKVWTTELQQHVANQCLQLHGGYGYTREYAVGRAFVDARIATIYGGTSEIMKEIIGRDLGL